MLNAGADRGLAAIRVGREEPGVHDVGPEGLDVLPQPPVAERVELPAFADQCDGNSRVAQIVFERSGVRKDSHMDVELIARQAAREQRKLFFSPAANEGGDNEQKANQGRFWILDFGFASV